MELGLKGKVALVTGSSRGIGRGIALAFAEAGCDLLLTGRDARALEEVAQSIRGKGRKVAVSVLDLRDPGAAETLVEAVRREFGGLDILINNAGGGASALRSSGRESRKRKCARSSVARLESSVT